MAQANKVHLVVIHREYWNGGPKVVEAHGDPTAAERRRDAMNAGFEAAGSGDESKVEIVEVPYFPGTGKA